MDIAIWRHVFRKSLISGSMASIASAISLLLLGKRELNSPAAPINAPSQWVWGKHAPYKNQFSLRYTLVGYVIFHTASIFWAMGYERARDHLSTSRKTSSVLVPAALTAVTAYAVDFHLTPKRFTPGFENRLSKKSLYIAYGTFALGLAAPALLKRYRLSQNKR